MGDILTPDYLALDFNTALEKLKTELANNDTFKDYNFEGANITVLLELMSYFSDLNTFFVNKVAKNVYSETTDIYECANPLARQVGYEPKGKRSARIYANMTISNTHAGDVLKVYPWKQFDSGRTTSIEEAIKFSTISTTEVTCTGTTTIISVPMRQGTVVNLTGFTGNDLVDNELVLPSNYAYDEDLNDDLPSIQVSVNDEIWTRISDFYDDIDPLTNIDNVYMFVYDRYERSKIVFNSSRNIPTTDDTINIVALESFGTDGSIGIDDAEVWIFDDEEVIEKTYETLTTFLSNDTISLSLTGTASVGAAEPETVDEVTTNAQSGLHAQFRNITSIDYMSHLEQRSDVIVANAWGEQDISPSGGSILEYNRIHLSTIPSEWNDNTIQTTTGVFTTDWGTSASIIVPVLYSTTWKTELKEYLLPRKMISAYEVFNFPELIYFSFDFGVRIKRLFTFSSVQQDIIDKLIYYFRAVNQNFNSIINFNDINEYILNTSNVSPDNIFGNINGIRNLNMRDINISHNVFEPNTIGNYPYWIESAYTGKDNQLRKIQLGLNQFPILSYDTLLIQEET